MKKLILHTLIFLFPIVVGIAILPVNSRLKYTGLENDCFNHGIWIYDRIHNNELTIDVAFLGSSKTVNGINDKLITKGLDTLHVANFGYCRLGRNLHYVLLKEILTGKKIKTLVIEVRESENWHSHPIFPFMANSTDVFFPNPFFNRAILSDMWNHSAYKIELFQDELYHEFPSVPIRKNPYGFATSSDTADYAYLDDIRKKRSKGKKELSGFGKKYHNNYSRVYLNKISRICNKNNIDLFFIYLPSYGSKYDIPREIKMYQKFGTVLIPPVDIYKDKNNWYNENHLNRAGADKISKWFTEVLKNNTF